MIAPKNCPELLGSDTRLLDELRTRFLVHRPAHGLHERVATSHLEANNSQLVGSMEPYSLRVRTFMPWGLVWIVE